MKTAMKNAIKPLKFSSEKTVSQPVIEPTASIPDEPIPDLVEHPPEEIKINDKSSDKTKLETPPYCKNCGKKVPHAAEFCPHCGIKLKL